MDLGYIIPSKVRRSGQEDCDDSFVKNPNLRGYEILHEFLRANKAQILFPKQLAMDASTDQRA